MLAKTLGPQFTRTGWSRFWALLKLGITGFYHYVSVKRLSRYVYEFCHRRNNRGEHALDFMAETAKQFRDRLLTHRQLVDGDSA